MTTLTTTLTLLRQHNACTERYAVLRKALGRGYGDTTPISLARIAQTNGLADALWCLQATVEDYATVVKPFLRLYLADGLEHLCLSAIPEAEKTLLLEGVTLLRDPATTNTQLNTYANKAWAAWDAAWAAGDAAWAAGDAAWAAGDAAWDAGAAGDAAWDAAGAAQAAAGDAGAAAWDAARAAGDAAWDAARAAEAAELAWWQQRFIDRLEGRTA